MLQKLDLLLLLLLFIFYPEIYPRLKTVKLKSKLDNLQSILFSRKMVIEVFVCVCVCLCVLCLF